MVIFYEGPSMIDGEPIVAIATIGSKNPKTGPMVQTWILRADSHPWEIVKTGEDKSICGTCPLRGYIADGKLVNRSCYVSVYQAPSNVWKAYKKGNYKQLTVANKHYFSGMALRYGSYGDPVAVPRSSWKMLESVCGKVRSGYTHQWQDSRFAEWKTVLMASTHTLLENRLAHGAGWRTFRTALSADEISSKEIVCPASELGGNRRDCASCGACNGNSSGSSDRKSVFIIAHGSDAKMKAMRNLYSLPVLTATA